MDHLTDDDLDRAVSDEASAETLEHLRRCEPCGQRLARLIAEEAPVRARLFRADCPASEELGEWQMGLLEPGQAARVRAHLALCRWCQEDLALISEVLAQPLSVAEPRFAGLRRLVAQIGETLPSEGPGRPALAVRGPAENVRTYQADDLQLSLSLEALAGGRVMLVGLLTHSGTALGSYAGTPVQLLQHEQVVAETALDELDNFTFDSLAPGRYDLALPVRDDVLVIEDLHLSTN